MLLQQLVATIEKMMTPFIQALAKNDGEIGVDQVAAREFEKDK
jgi:hypothetical protein